MILIGIDPPKGYAVWNTELKYISQIRTLDFWGIIDDLHRVAEAPRPEDFKVYIEAPQENKPVWIRKGQSPQMMSKIAQNVGENKGASKLIIEYMKLHDIEYEAVKPTKNSMTKLPIKQFQAITGWKHRTSEHGRDAAMLVFGRNK